MSTTQKTSGGADTQEVQGGRVGSDVAVGDLRDPLSVNELSDPLQAIQLKDATVGGGTVSGARPSAAGGRDRLPSDLQHKMEASFGADFSGVGVHEGAEAGALGAQAFARGDELHFAPGQYDPGSRGGQELIGHELAHVVQQRAGRVRGAQGKGMPINASASLERQADQAGARAAAGHPAGMGGGTGAASGDAIQLKSLETHGGTFSADQYEALTGKLVDDSGSDLKKQAVGATMDLSFAPIEAVRGKFGLVQVGRATRTTIAGDTGVDLKDGEKKDRATGDGWFFDRSDKKENPVFGTQNQRGVLLGEHGEAEGIDFGDNTDSLKKTEGTKVDKSARPKKGETKGQTYTDTERKSDKAGQVGEQTESGVKVAALRDEPARTRSWDPKLGVGDQIKMEFESAALGLGGDVKGTYLGSVRWGFSIGGGDTSAKVHKFELASMGAPTKTFARAAQKWNEQEEVSTGGRNKLLTLPVGITDSGVDDDYMEKLDQAESDLERKTLKMQRLTELDKRLLTLSSESLRDARSSLDEATQEELVPLQTLVAELDSKNQKAYLRRRELEVAYNEFVGPTLRNARTARDEAQTALDGLSGVKSAILKRRSRKRAKKALKDAQRKVDHLTIMKDRINTELGETGRILGETDAAIKKLVLSDQARQYRTKRVDWQNIYTTFKTTRFERDALQKELAGD